MEGGLVLEVDGDGVKVAGGLELDFLDCPALHLSELYELAMRETALNEGKRCRAELRTSSFCHSERLLSTRGICFRFLPLLFALADC